MTPTTTDAPYVELHCHSALSLLDGASLPEALAQRAAGLGYAALALTDHDELGGIVRFGTACEAVGINGILGAEITVLVPDRLGADFHTYAPTRDAPTRDAPTRDTHAREARPTHLVLLAETREGYGNISTLITRARMDTPRGTPADRPIPTPHAAITSRSTSRATRSRSG